MSGPVAPKNPEKKRPYFYIMRDKEIFGAKQEDGLGTHFIYQNDGRLINSAQIVGNITDTEILNHMKTSQGIRRLVHSIGVSVEMDRGIEEREVEFVFQMYGRNDTYGGGTIISKALLGDGVEEQIILDEICWSKDDLEPGQIRFVFCKPELIAKASIRFFLKDGFDAPEVKEEETVDFHSQKYHKMIEHSLMSTGNPTRLLRVMKSSKEGKEINMAFIGGSITQGAGAIPINHACYAYRSFEQFQERFGNNDNVNFVKAGVGGTPSELGMIRFERDIVRNEQYPDLVIVEFAVNDYGDETKGDCYESLVRKILRLPNQPAVVLLFSVFANDENLQDRLAPIGEHYELPMVSIKDAVTTQFRLSKEEGRVLTKNQFFYDIYHPQNMGHTIMADCLTNLFERVHADAEKKTSVTIDRTDDILLERPKIGKTFEQVELLDRMDSYDGATICFGGFAEVDKELQKVEMDDSLLLTAEFPNNWMYNGKDSNGTSFFMEIECKALVLIYKDSGSLSSAKAEVFVDEKYTLTADPRVNGWIHCNSVIIINNEKSDRHNVRIQIVKGDEDKQFTILGFGYVR